MEKQRIDRIMQMIESSDALKEQYKRDKEETINIIYAWLDAEDKGKELDPYYSKREALGFEIKNLEHDLLAYQERGQIAEAALIADKLFITKKRLTLVGKEAEFPEEVAELRLMEQSLEDSKAGLQEYKEQGTKLK